MLCASPGEIAACEIHRPDGCRILNALANDWEMKAALRKTAHHIIDEKKGNVNVHTFQALITDWAVGQR